MTNPRHHNIRLRFDFTSSTGTRETKHFSRPVEVLEARELTEVEMLFRRLDEEMDNGRIAAGFVTYEAAPAFDRPLTTKTAISGLPLVWFGIFTSSDEEGLPDPLTEASPAEVAWTADTTPVEFANDIAAIREAISNGETYQVNYTFRLHGAVDARDVDALYQHLRSVHASPYAAHLAIGDWHVVSLSPELFFNVEHGMISSRPMKGTASRGLWPEDDRNQAARLLASDKDRSENVMIVDLVRNDLTRVSEVGSVRASSLFDLERYPSVWQMTSTVEGRLRANTSTFDVFSALFPAGSITGAPKSSAMRTIQVLERSPRGIYTGAIGYISKDRTIFNVAIRTATIDAHTGAATAGVGGGITWESSADAEHAEALRKAAFFTATPSFDLLETMRLANGRVVRLDGHLARMAESAAFLDFACDLLTVRAALGDLARRHSEGTHRVRLTLSRSGAVTTELLSLPVPPTSPAPVALALVPVSSRQPSLFHKTTNRGIYDNARASQSTVFDVLLWNERRELTEFTIGNVVVELDDARYTPPREAGLLAGVFRAELLRDGAIVERTIAIDELERITRMWLVNSLREWVEVRLVDR